MTKLRWNKSREPGDESDTEMDLAPQTGIGRLPVDDDSSYQGRPAEGYDNSRSVGITGFKSGANVSGPNLPKDFGFLLKHLQDQRTPPYSLGTPSSNSGSSLSTPVRVLTPHTSAETDDSLDEVVHRKTKKRGLTMDIDPSPAQAVDCVPVWEPGTLRCLFDVKGKDAKLSAPRPPKRPRNVFFGRADGEDRGDNSMDPPISRTDVFFWMRDDTRQNEEVLGLLREEEAYTAQETADLEPLRKILNEEMCLHLKETDKGTLIPHPGGYAYYSCSSEGKDYNKHFRVRIAQDGIPIGDEEFLLDENELSIDSDGNKRPFCSFCEIEPSPDHQILSYATDFEGDEAYDIHFKAISTPGATETASAVLGTLPKSIGNTTGTVCWSPGADRFYYVTLDGEKRSEAVKVRTIGDDADEDIVVFEEANKKFWVSIHHTTCRRFLIISSCSSETSEQLVLDFQARDSCSLQLVAGRQFSHRYRVDYRAGYFYILTNKDEAKDLKLCRVAEQNLHLGTAAWEDLWVPGPGICLDSHLCFETFMAVSGREKGQSCIFIYEYDSENPLHVVAFPSTVAHSGFIVTPKGRVSSTYAHSASIDCSNRIFRADTLRCSYSSFTNPGCAFEYHVKSRAFKLLKAEEVPGFEEHRYGSDLIMSQRRGVPISLVYRKDIHPDGLGGGPFPLLLTGYGAYGVCSEPDFDGNRLSFLDRGMVYAVAHIRGGGELGRDWYEQGRYMKVKNRFEDFVDVADTLVNLGITDSSKLAAWGTSSGGLLVGASVNLRPDLFRAVLMEVPFVDVLNTMCDPSIPLTVGEWEEIGNPNEREYFFYMSEYSAYDNLRMQDYPAFMITTALNDTMVGYWEPLKYISKLRLMKTDSRPTLLKVNFHGGHEGVSGKYNRIKDFAFHCAFLLNQLGLGARRLNSQ